MGENNLTVYLSFDPAKPSYDPLLKRVFENRDSRIVWLFVKSRNKEIENLETGCILMAHMVEGRTQIIGGGELDTYLKICQLIDDKEQGVGEELRSYLAGEKTIDYAVGGGGITSDI